MAEGHDAGISLSSGKTNKGREHFNDDHFTKGLGTRLIQR